MKINWYKLLRPYTYHLEQEIEYLKELLSQTQRRLDIEMEKKVIKQTPILDFQKEKIKSDVILPTKPTNWETYKKQYEEDLNSIIGLTEEGETHGI